LVVIVAPESVDGDVELSDVFGAVLSIVIETLVSELVFPAGSVTVVERVVVPSGRGEDGTTEYVPLAETTPVPMIVPDPSLRVTVDPTSPVPVTVGVVSLVMSPSVGLPMLGFVGAVVSTVNGILVGVLVLPSVSVRVTEYAYDPSGREVRV
jgi:hypothetical protein